MKEVIDFKTRITAQRPYARSNNNRPWTTNGYLDYLTGQLESDRGRIINSPAIRRLQQKTQVFPLERNATVRSRLTHSLEVQQTGRFILRTIFKKLNDKDLTAQYGLEQLERALESIVEMACLSHDIGNPPFGHFGEHAINSWFTENLTSIKEFIGNHVSNAELEQKMLLDLQSFEGNAQAIRLVANLLVLNLTYTQTASLLKYVRPAYEPKPDKKADGAYLRKKPGFYLSEEDFVHELWSALGMPLGSRHPVTWIMEAADDISYGLADIEDAVEKGILDIKQIKELLEKEFKALGDINEANFITLSKNTQSFQEIINFAAQRAEATPINKSSEFFLWLRVNLIHSLVQHAADRFIDNIESIYAGHFDHALMEDDSLNSLAIETLKGVARKEVFSNREVETLELQGYRIIFGLIDLYSPLLRCSAEEFNATLDQDKSASPYLKRLAGRLAERHVKAYRLATEKVNGQANEVLWEFYYRCRLLQDFISGMTDQYAYDEYKILTVAGSHL
ncbi:dGTPase [Halomonas sp. MCCC 1A11036]|uniref:Probable deoxyguanosinetriphosphate triphosphohydrolase n=1 Tax=Billgrantia zhangzhouensis TaxID=2733481 RepID=A0ABS9AH59_9GAMM|nr:dGTPase [Halomonas zhangzhouensis]MCE8021093.1 dGTPase [Halomonas zhangzhouensis]